MSVDVIRGDRRANRRYELELQVCFSYTDESGVHRGCGTTAELSRGGVRFFAAEAPPVHACLDARIAWPFLLQGICPLEIAVKGSVISSTRRGTVLQIRNYEFRTCGERSFSDAPDQPLTLRIA